jgi:hypothetical protein
LQPSCLYLRARYDGCILFSWCVCDALPAHASQRSAVISRLMEIDCETPRLTRHSTTIATPPWSGVCNEMNNTDAVPIFIQTQLHILLSHEILWRTNSGGRPAAGVCEINLPNGKRSRGSSVSIMSDYGLKDPEIGFRSPAVSVSRPVLGPTQPPVQWVPWVLSPGVKNGRGVTQTTHPIKCRGQEWVEAISPLPPSASMACGGTALLLITEYRHGGATLHVTRRKSYRTNADHW